MNWRILVWVRGLTNLINNKLFSCFYIPHFPFTFDTIVCNQQMIYFLVIRKYNGFRCWETAVEWMKNWCNLLCTFYKFWVYRMFCSMQCLQPVDPDVQKHRILKQHEQRQQAIKLYTLDNQQKIIHLFKHVNFAPFFCVFCHFHSVRFLTSSTNVYKLLLSDLSFIWFNSLGFR